MEDRRNVHRFVAVMAIVVTACLGHATRAANGNGYVPEKGQCEVALSYSAETYDRFWAGESETDVPNGGDVDVKSLSLWTQYGLTERLSLQANLPYVEADSDGFQSENESLQDFTLLARYRICGFESDVRQTLVGGFGIRTLASNYDVPGPVDIGDGTADWLFRLTYQLETGGFYLSWQAGFDLRSADAPNGIPLHTELGFTGGAVTYSAFYSRLDARGGTDIGPGFFTFPSNEEEYQRAGVKVYGRVSDTLALFGSAVTTLDGRNTGDITGFAAGVVLQRGAARPNVHFRK